MFYHLLFRIVGLFVLSSLFAFSPIVQPDEIDDLKAKIYVEKYKHIAIAEMDRTGIPASIKMAQAILESGCGESELATVANNHFGIKCGGDVWQGDTHYVWDDEEVKSCFRVYDNAESSFIAHSEFLMNPKKDFRYGFLFDLDKRDYIEWAKGLQKSGYATSKTYSKNLISIIERLELYKLDYLTVELLAVNEGELASIFPTLAPNPTLADNDTTSGSTRVIDPFSSNADSVDVVLTMFVFKVNNAEAVYVQQDDNLEKIANRYRKNARKLFCYNELRGRSLKVGQYLFLQPKMNSYATAQSKKGSNIHIVRKGQSMYDIAQLYGIKLRKLYAYNKKYRRSIPDPGARIYLSKPPR